MHSSTRILVNSYCAENRQQNFQIIEGGSRRLYWYMLPWTDADINSDPLVFKISDDFENAAFYARNNPNAPVKEFTSGELIHGDIIIKHFRGRKKYFEIKLVRIFFL